MKLGGRSVLYRYLAVWAAGIVVMMLWSLLFGPVAIERLTWDQLFFHVRTQLSRPEVLQSDQIIWWSLLVAVLGTRTWVHSISAAPANASVLGPGAAQYSVLPNEQGGVIDDISPVAAATSPRQARASSSHRVDSSRHFDYLLLWIVGTVLVVNWGVWFIEKITPFDFGPPEQNTTGAAAGSGSDVVVEAVSILDVPVTVALVATWTGLVILLLLFLGDGVKRGFYETALAPYKAVLMTLTVVIMLTFLANVTAYVGIQSRVGSFEAPVLLLKSTVRELSTSADEIYHSATSLQTAVVFARRALEEEPRQAAPGTPSASTEAMPDQAAGDVPPTSAVPRTRMVKPPKELAAQGATIVQRSRGTYDLAFAAVNQLETAMAMEYALLEAAAAAAVTPQPASQTATTAPLETPASETRRNATTAATLAEAELPPVEAVLRDAQVSANDLDAVANVLDNFDLPYLRGRDEATFFPRQLEYDLAEIASHSRAIHLRAEAASHALAGLENRGTSILLWLAAFYAAFVLLPWVLLLMFFYRKREYRAIEIFDDLRRLDPSETLLRRALGTASNPRNRSAPDLDDLVERAFSNREYVLSVSLLTVLTAAGWYYFLYPRADIGISALIRSDAGITQLTEDLSQYASPVTMGFAGAYFFVTQMLLRRYLAGDLYPSAFLQASVRIIWVFTLSVALAVLLPNLSVPGLARTAPIEIEPAYIATIAFVAGIFPREGFRFIFSAVSELMGRLFAWVPRGKGFPADTDSAPLTELEGINIWVESRFLEENVENVQGMATAPIERLVVGTYYPASRIVDWVDQAILMSHCGVDHVWYPSLRRVGIRTATDLLDAASPAGQGRRNFDTAIFDPDGPDGDPLKKLAAALAAAATAYKVDTPNPTACILAEMCTVIWPDPNLRYIQRYRDSVDKETAAMTPLKPAGSAAETANGTIAAPEIKTAAQTEAGNGHAANGDTSPSPDLGGRAHQRPVMTPSQRSSQGRSAARGRA